MKKSRQYCTPNIGSIAASSPLGLVGFVVDAYIKTSLLYFPELKFVNRKINRILIGATGAFASIRADFIY